MEIKVDLVWADDRIYVEFEKNPELVIYNNKERPFGSISLKMQEAENLIKQLQEGIDLFRKCNEDCETYLKDQK